MVSRGRAGGTFSVEHATFNAEAVRELVEIGYPRIGQGLASDFGSMATVVIIFAAAGAAGLAAYTIVSRVIVLSMLVVGPDGG